MSLALIRPVLSLMAFSVATTKLVQFVSGIWYLRYLLQGE